MIYKKTIFTLVMFACSLSVFSQGGWNIKYIPIDSLDETFVGKEFRIDFKGSKLDTIKGKVKTLGIRKLLSKRDSVQLNISGEKIKFIESWRLYVDHGVLSEQSLESISNNEKERIQIREMFLESINDSTLTFEVSIYVKKCNVSATKENRVKKEKITINKSDIKGLLVKSS